MYDPICSVEGCGKPHFSRSWCRTHHARWYRTGTVELFPRVKETAQERFEKYVNKTPDGCWLWMGSTRTGGYPTLWDGERLLPAHRWSYIQRFGPIPEGFVMDHLCRVRRCVNPDHLEVVTNEENIRRGYAARKVEQ